MPKLIVFTHDEKALIGKVIKLRLEYDPQWESRFEGVIQEVNYPDSLLQTKQKSAICGCINEFEERLVSSGYSKTTINHLLQKLK